MKDSGSMKKIFGENGEQLPLLIGLILILIVANYVFLSTKIPIWACHAVTVVLIIAAAWCASAGSKYVRKQHYEYLQRREEVLFKKIEGLNDMLDSLKRHATLSNKQSGDSMGSWTEATDKLLEVFENRTKEVQASLAGQAEIIEEKVVSKMSGDLSVLSEKVEALLSSEPQTGNEWADDVEKNLVNAFHSLEDKIAVQLGESVRKLDAVLTTMNDHNDVFSSKQSETSEAIKQWMETERNTSLEEVLFKLDSVVGEMKEFAARPSENTSDPQMVETLIADRMDPILLNLEEGRKLLENLGALVQNDEQKTSSLLADVSERLLSDMQSAQEEKYQLLKKEIEALTRRLEEGIQPISAESSETSSLVSQTVELTKTLEEKRQQDAEQFDLIKKQMDVIERVLVGKVMESTTGSTVESIAKMSAELNRSIRELQSAGQGTEKMFHVVNSELSAVKEKLEQLSLATADGENSESTQMNAELAESLSNILLRLDNIEKKSAMSKTNVGALSVETEKVNAMLTEKMEQFGELVNGMQNEISRLLLRVLVSQDDHTERVQKTYDSMLSQISGMMNDTKRDLDLLKHSVEDGHRVLSENDRQSLKTAEEQLVQNTAMKEKIDVYSSVSENYRKDMLMKLDYLQQQMQSLNLLAEVLRDVSMNSKLYNFRSDVR